MRKTDILIVGCGVAGLYCALNLPRDKQILIVTKKSAEESDSFLAQGGICVLPEESAALCRTALSLPHLRLVGFMTMGPVCESEAEYRAYFRETVALGRALWLELGLAGEPRFSMGMSQSFTAAIKEGADWVRVGRGLFAGRPESNE